MKWAAAASVCVASLGLGAATASADPTTDQCLASSLSGQQLQGKGKLLDARKQLLVCAAASCPDAVKADCTERATEVDKAIPTVVFDAKDGSGSDRSAVRVAVDGVQVADHLDGLPIAVDPGQHTFTFSMAGAPAVQRNLLIVEGEKARHEHIVMTAPDAPGPAAPSPAPPVSAPETSASSWSSRKTAALITAGAGVVGLGVGTVSGLIASSDWSKARSECNTQTCPNHGGAVQDHDATTTAATVSTVGFIAGGVLLAGGAVLFFTAPSGSSPSTDSASLRVVPSAGPGAAAMLLQGTFR
jgi:hypothetical protein